MNKYIYLILFISQSLSLKTKQDIDNCVSTYNLLCELLSDCSFQFFELTSHVQDGENQDCQYINDNKQQYIDNPNQLWSSTFHSKFQNCFIEFIDGELQQKTLRYQYFTSVYHCLFPNIFKQLIHQIDGEELYHPLHFVKDNVVITQTIFTACQLQVSPTCDASCGVTLQVVCGALLSTEPHCDYVYGLQNFDSGAQWPYQIRHDFHICFDMCLELFDQAILAQPGNPVLSPTKQHMQGQQICGGAAPVVDLSYGDGEQDDGELSFLQYIYECANQFDELCTGDCYSHIKEVCGKDSDIYILESCLDSRNYTIGIIDGEDLFNLQEQYQILKCFDSCLDALELQSAITHANNLRQCIEFRYNMDFPDSDTELEGDGEQSENEPNNDGEYDEDLQKQDKDNKNLSIKSYSTILQLKYCLIIFFIIYFSYI